MNQDHEPHQPALLTPTIQTMGRLVMLVTLLAIAGLAMNASTETGSNPRGGPDHEFKIDLNAADERELMLMPGIGMLTAGRILENRRRHGPFRSVDDLQRVSGIGPKTVREIAPYCKVVTVGEISSPLEDQPQQFVPMPPSPLVTDQGS